MKEFKIKPGAFDEIKKLLLIRTIPFILLVLIGGIIITSVKVKGKEAEIDSLAFAIPFALLAIGVGLYRGMKRQKGLYESYTLVITNNFIGREQLNTPTISMYFNDVREIIRRSNGDFIIKGKEATDIITVPRQIEDYDQVEILLAQIKPIVNKSKDSFFGKYRIVLPFLTITLMTAVYAVTNKIVVAVAGLALIVIMLWSFMEVRKSKNIDAKTKRGMWWILLVLASVAAVVIMKLTGAYKV